MRGRLWLVWLLLLVSAGACADQSSGQPSPTEPESTTTRLEDGSTTTSPVAPGTDILVATDADGFAEVEEALADAVERWETEGHGTYGYRVRTHCSECADQDDTMWVRRFDPDWPDDMAWDVDELYRRINDALEESPERIEVAFHPDHGIPVWFQVEGDGSESFLMELYHEITRAATPFDGEWRFIGGQLDGQAFENPTTGLIAATLGDGHMSFPIDCNEGGGPVDIHESHFGIGEIALTAMGCVEYSEEADLFVRALGHATTIEERDPQLVLSSDDSVLRFVPLERPERRGELPRTAAGETLLIEPHQDGQAAVFTISSGSRQRNPARRVEYALTGASPDSEDDPSWRPWDGEFEVPEAPVGAVVVAIPEDIVVGDYHLCSPYWSENFFCYDLLVRPPSAPWYVTAGSDGVVLHDADGTSETVWEEPARIAFWFEDLLVVENESGPVVAVRDSREQVEVAPAGTRLLDATSVDSSILLLVVRDGQTMLVDFASGEETTLGAEASDGRFAGAVVVLRTAPTRVEARSGRDGETLWELEVEPEEMISSVTPSELRLDQGRLNTDGPPNSFWQYMDTRIVDVNTGEVTDEFRHELAIPLEDDAVTEPCVRAELQDGLMLCPQRDGRFATIGVEHGDQLAVPEATEGTATYVRTAP